jgi:hypothetical protein
MAYDNDLTVYVEDEAGDVGAPGAMPFWLSPDVDIPAHSGRAVQGSNDVRIRVHANDEPTIDSKIVAEVYVGNPSLVMSPTSNTVRIDPGNLLFRTNNVAGTEPVANVAGATLTFPWTPSSSSTNVDGPGHRCLVLRAFPQNVTPPTSPFTVPTEQHEAQHNIEVLTTTTAPKQRKQGDGTPGDPRRIDPGTGLWWERLSTRATGKKGRRFVIWAFDPSPSKALLATVRNQFKELKVRGISDAPPAVVTLGAEGADFEKIDVGSVVKGRLAKRAGMGTGLFAQDRLVAAAGVYLGPRREAGVLLGFDHSNLQKRSAVVLHGVQFDESWTPEGGMTVVAVAPTDS